MVFSDLVNIGTGRSRSQDDPFVENRPLSLDLSKSFDLNSLRYAMMAKDTYFCLQLTYIENINSIISP